MVSRFSAEMPYAAPENAAQGGAQISAQVQKSYGFDKAKADAEVKQFMGARTF
jgi:hypothetical protein